MQSDGGKMKVVGLITEYNPFHNGHQYHIEEAKRITGADYCIAVMSGDFVQRGTPAILDKYNRAEMALQAGVDLVLELPVCYATASAELFALGAVSLLDKLGIVDFLCFGSECGNISAIKEIARILQEKPHGFQEQLLSLLKEGFTYPAARMKALEECLRCQATVFGDATLADAAFTDSPSVDAASVDKSPSYETLSHILFSPNNILGIEYVKAMDVISSSITPVSIQRKTASYHDQDLTGLKQPLNISLPDVLDLTPVISSASAIRNVIRNSDGILDLSQAANSLPTFVFDCLHQNYDITYPITEDDFLRIIVYKILSEGSSSLCGYADITGDLARRMKKFSCYSQSFDWLAKNLKTRNITLTRINRALIHLLLNIKTDSMTAYSSNGYTFYARVLGIKKESSHLLRQIKKNGKIPVITKVSQTGSQLDSLGSQMLSTDLFAADLYNQAICEKYGTSLPNEYQRGICIL
jgi:predicted nucleotidyltransferase